MCAILAEIDASNRQLATAGNDGQQQAMVSGQQATLIVIEGQLFTLGRPSPAPVAVPRAAAMRNVELECETCWHWESLCSCRCTALDNGVAVAVAVLLLAAPLALWHAK